MATININEANNQLSSGSPSFAVPSSPVPGSQLPQATFKNNTSLSLTLSFSTTPFTESEYAIAGNGSVTPTWKSSVTAQAYGFTVSEATSKRDTGVRPANGSITISVMSA